LSIFNYFFYYFFILKIYIPERGEEALVLDDDGCGGGTAINALRA
jgi:hypothetical protein